MQVTKGLGAVVAVLLMCSCVASRQAPANSAPVVRKDMMGDDGLAYTRGSRELLQQGKFDQLDDFAHSIRERKQRASGGSWALYSLYEGLEQPSVNAATEEAWAQHFAVLNRWVSTKPQSITARVALASAYVEYAFVARGHGYADSVTPEGWKLFAERLARAESVLNDAAELREKCPHWYFEMLEVAHLEDWDRERTRALLERAMAFDPLYYHSYREYASHLLPKWGGKPGEVEAFAEEIAKKLGGKQGAFAYFEIATVIYCECNGEPVKPTMSWPRIKEGFAVVQELYGVPSLKMNRMAFMAVLYSDKATARDMFVRMGLYWEPNIWFNHKRFEEAKTWAGA